MEGLIPFVIDAIRKSNVRGGYRCVSSDGSSHGSSRHLMDYAELPEDAGVSSGSSASGGAWSEFVKATADVQRTEEHAIRTRPAAVVAGSAYRRK